MKAAIITFFIGILIASAAYSLRSHEPAEETAAIETEETAGAAMPFVDKEEQTDADAPIAEQEANDPEQAATSSIPSFSSPGNIVRSDSGAGWDFVYEETGQPSIRASLIFTDESICDIGRGKESCDEIIWRAGDRIRVEGTRTDEGIAVLRAAKI